MSTVNRNDPCPCGSGRKAKNCCMRAEVPKGRRPVVDVPALDGFPPRTMPLAEATALAQRYHSNHDFQTAGALFRLILDADADFDKARFYYGVLLHQTGSSDEGVALMKSVADKHPNVYEYSDNLGRIYDDRRQVLESIEYFRRALKLQQDSDAYYNLGVALMNHGALEEAADCFRKSIKLQPYHKSTMNFNNLGTILQKQGKLQEAIECIKMALAQSPDELLLNGNYLYMHNFMARPDLPMIFEEHKKIGRKYEQVALKSPQGPQANAGRPAKPAGRPLRLGYLSPDFRKHAVAHFIEPVIAAHDRGKFELYCYYHHAIIDDTTMRFQKLVPNWRSILDRSDDEIAAMIRRDEIDILVDLAGHTGLNRLPVFARKPAPVQVTWLGYPNTTGLTTMDYRITDSHADPPGQSEAFHTEKLVRLPDCFSCIRAPEESPDVGPLPALKAGHVTFGSFNLLAKMPPDVMAVWARILLRVPGSRLILKYFGLDSDYMRSLIRGIFRGHGVAPERVQTLGHDASQAAHLQRYNSIDIALDPFPYNGTTTTLDALWMGVPVVTLAGISHVGRVGVSQLSNIGLPELIAKDDNEYVEIAAALAGDLTGLAALRAGLRDRVRSSPLMDAERFTRHLERAYESMWQEHLHKGAS